MAVAILYQRNRDAQVMKQVTLFPAATWRGIAFDGSFLWTSAADLNQIDTSSFTLLKTVTASETYDCLAYDGEYFWGCVSGNAGIGQITRDGQRVNFIGSVTSSSPTGIAYDGAYLWVLYVFGGNALLSQLEMYSASIDKTFNLGAITTLDGLTFDGEFLVAQGYPGAGTRTFYYIDRGTGAIVRTVAEFVGGGDAHGFAFDGEYFYTMLAV